MSLLMIGKVLNLGDVFLVFLDSIGVSTEYRKVVATITPSVPLALKISLLVVLVLFASLALVGGKLLVLVIRYISRRSVSGLSPS